MPPNGGGAEPPHAVCRHCGAPLHAEHVEARLRNAEPAVLGSGLFEADEEATESDADGHTSSAEFQLVPKKRHAKRGDDYYWQLYFDYTAEPAPGADESQPSAASTAYPGSYNGNGNGNGNGSQHVDLAITDTVPLTMFAESEMAPAQDQDAQQPGAEGGSPPPTSAGNYNEFEYELINDPSRLAQVAEMLAQERVLGIDTETTGLDPHTCELLLLQLSTDDKVYIVDCRRLVPLALKPVLENPEILKVAQNAKFEYEMLRQQVGITLAGIFDTMLAERICTAGHGREISLKQISAKYIGAVLDKAVREAFYKTAHIGDAYLAPEQLHYAARDAFIMLPIWRLQQKELRRLKLEQIADLEFRCVAAVGDMELAGVKIDEVKWRKIIEDVGVQREAAAAELCEMLQSATMQATMFGVPSINLNSSTQLMEAFSNLGVDLPDTMESTLVKFSHPAVAKLLEYRSHEKTLSAFGENVLSLINPKTGRIHPDFNQHGADTGRFSCNRPNVQQIPATSDFRKCFIAPEGYKLVTCDYSQAELRILAELSLDPGFVSAFQSGGDLHSLTASQMFGVPLEEVQKPQRSAAKAINFGLAYGMGPGGLAPRLGVSLDEAKGLISRYFKAYPGVQQWLDKAAKDAVRLGYSVTTLGRKRFYNMPDDSLKRQNEDEWRKQIGAIERQGKNSPIQGSNADMTKLALIYIRAALKDWDARTVNTVHDEIVVEVRTDQAEEVKQIVEYEMVRAGEAILKEVPIVAEAALADYWSK